MSFRREAFGPVVTKNRPLRVDSEKGEGTEKLLESPFFKNLSQNCHISAQDRQGEVAC